MNNQPMARDNRGTRGLIRGRRCKLTVEYYSKKNPSRMFLNVTHELRLLGEPKEEEKNVFRNWARLFGPGQKPSSLIRDPGERRERKWSMIKASVLEC